MHPNGGYVYLKFSINYYNEFSLIFPINAQFKDPLLLKQRTEFLSFDDKYFYGKCDITERKLVKKEIHADHKNDADHKDT